MDYRRRRQARRRRSTRSAGLALIPALAVEAWTRAGARAHGRSPAPRGGVRRGWVPLLYARTGPRGGRAGADRRAGRVGRHLTFPLLALGRGGHSGCAVIASSRVASWTADAVVTAARHSSPRDRLAPCPPNLRVYATSSLLFPLSDPSWGRPLLSIPRFAAVLFPMAWVWASSCRRARGSSPAWRSVRRAGASWHCGSSIGGRSSRAARRDPGQTGEPSVRDGGERVRARRGRCPRPGTSRRPARTGSRPRSAARGSQ